MYFVVLLALVKPLGAFMARVLDGKPVLLERLLGPLERGLYRLAGIDPRQEMSWRVYALAMLAFQAVGILALYALQRLQHYLPANPEQMAGVPSMVAFNTAASFVSNTNWQAYGGETTMSYLTQMLGLTVQNFVSAATGIAILAALARGFSRCNENGLGNFWVDLTRSTLYILLPLSVIWALFLISQGVPQNFGDYESVKTLQGQTEQVVARGPAASQVAIKQLGTNGGGFFNANSAHPFENPTPLSNFALMLSILLIPAALCYTFGQLAGDRLQGWALLAAMTLIFAAVVAFCVGAEMQGNPRLAAMGVDISAGNMEGKEVRFGTVLSALYAVCTTAASNGSVNSMHDSFTPLGGLCLLVMMQLGEVVYGGVGSGLYGMLVFALVAVFTAGLMVGRTPEYLGKKIEAYDIKMCSLVILIMPAVVLGLSAWAMVNPAAKGAVANTGPHGFSEILYAFTSMGNNNGSAFGGLTATGPIYSVGGGLAMLVSRYWLALPVLALAGSLVAKKKVPPGPGTLPTHGPLFVFWLVTVVLVVGALAFLPALALGPVVEHFMLPTGVVF
ncbi:MAG: potassium-transporting ATPase potassium-binding subunit [Candidatus Xenobia bacterium]